MPAEGKLELIVRQQTGVLSRVSVWLAQHGYRIKTNQREDNNNDATTRLTLHLEGEFPIPQDILSALGELPDSVAVVQAQSANDSETGNPPGNDTDQKIRKNLESIVNDVWSSFPKIKEKVFMFSKLLSDDNRGAILQKLGFQIGGQLYDKEYALGSRLNFDAALKRMLVPALKPFGKPELSDSIIILNNNIFCEQGMGNSSCCNFIEGFMVGFLDAGQYKADIQQQQCVSNGDSSCSFILAK